jgi:HAD superfamily hydrolase (TIGR01509 family)
MAEAIIFDIDGTLLDSVDQHAKAWVDAFAEFGHSLSFTDVRRQIGKGGDQLMPVFLTEPELARVGKRLDDRRSTIFKERYLPSVRPFADVRPLLTRLRANGKTLVLASSAKREEVDVYKKIAGIEDLIEVDTSSDDADQSKPAPDIFLAALKRLQGVKADGALVVGDTPYDAQAAAKAGLRTIGVTCGGWSVHELRAAGCTAVYAGPSDLLASITAWSDA